MRRRNHQRRSDKTSVFDEAEIELEFDYSPGAEPTGPTYACGGEPGYGPEVDLTKFTITFASRRDGTFVLHEEDLTPDAKGKLRAYLSERFYEEMCSEVEDALEEI
jgi:hypothetical protein